MDSESPTSAETSDVEPVAPASPTAPSSSSGAPWLIAAGVAGAAVMLFLVATQIYLVTAVNDTRAELTSTRQDLDSARTEVALLEAQIGEVSASVDEVAEDTRTAASASPSLGESTTPEGVLPRYVPGQPDGAVGMRLTAVTGTDAYGDDPITIDPADGQKRVWMIWAHWCPYCQDELPALADSYDAYRSQYPNISIETISTSIDPQRANPLDPYLEESQFPFSVIVDEDSTLAARLGVNAFPFWVITDGDGTVLLRSAGYLDAGQLDDLLQSLDTYDA